MGEERVDSCYSRDGIFCDRICETDSVKIAKSLTLHFNVVEM